MHTAITTTAFIITAAIGTAESHASAQLAGQARIIAGLFRFRTGAILNWPARSPSDMPVARISCRRAS